LETELVAVIAEGAPAYARSLAANRIVEAPVDTIADGMACRRPNAEALATFSAHNIRCVCVTDAEISAAMRLYFSLTHNVAEGAGAASLNAGSRTARHPGGASASSSRAETSTAMRLREYWPAARRPAIEPAGVPLRTQ
jgi:threonine dehydratase